MNTEPNIETALTWWSDLPDKWTPVGWKDHMFRFNVAFNGAIIAQPDLNRWTEKWAGQGVQILPVPSSGSSPSSAGSWRDDNSVVQGWNDCAAPVLWSEWVHEGLV